MNRHQASRLRRVTRQDAPCERPSNKVHSVKESVNHNHNLPFADSQLRLLVDCITSPIGATTPPIEYYIIILRNQVTEYLLRTQECDRGIGPQTSCLRHPPKTPSISKFQLSLPLTS
jgi:hypothetical protein